VNDRHITRVLEMSAEATQPAESPMPDAAPVRETGKKCQQGRTGCRGRCPWRRHGGACELGRFSGDDEDYPEEEGADERSFTKEEKRELKKKLWRYFRTKKHGGPLPCRRLEFKRVWILSKRGAAAFGSGEGFNFRRGGFGGPQSRHAGPWGRFGCRGKFGGFAGQWRGFGGRGLPLASPDLDSMGVHRAASAGRVGTAPGVVGKALPLLKRIQ
jgi:hypothetical protein